MHDRQHRSDGARATLCALILLSSSGCALLANLGGPAAESSDEGRPGSRSPDGADETSQREGGVNTACGADLANDSRHCGFCDHDCGGASCTAGLCAPQKMATTTDLRLLAVDADDGIFMTTEHEVRGCSAGPTAPCKSLIDKSLAAEAVRAWGPGSGGGKPPESPNNQSNGSPSAALPLQPRALALYGGRFFVADQANGAIFACPKAGCGASSIATVFPEATPDFAGGLAVNSSVVAWGEKDGLGEAALPASGLYTDGRTFRAALLRDVTRIEMTKPDVDAFAFRGADGVFALAPAPAIDTTELLAGPSIRDFAFADPRAYVATKTSVIRIDRAAGTRTTLVELAGEEVVRLIADSNGVYATVSGAFGQKLVRVRPGGIDTIATASVMSAIALSPSWVYFAGNDAIWRVAR